MAGLYRYLLIGDFGWMFPIGISATDASGGIRERVEGYPNAVATSTPGGGCQKLFSQLATDPRHTPLQRLRNGAMA